MMAMAVVLGLVCVLSVVLCTELRRSKVPPSAARAVNPVPDGSTSMIGELRVVAPNIFLVMSVMFCALVTSPKV